MSEDSKQNSPKGVRLSDEELDAIEIIKRRYGVRSRSAAIRIALLATSRRIARSEQPK